MIIDCISDLHGFYPELSGGDLLIVAGDLTATDEEDQYYKFNSWLCDQDYKNKIVIAGNHDNLLQIDSFQYLEGYPAFEYLCDSGTEFNGLKIWGSPWTKSFPYINPHCKAFTVDSEEKLAEKWALIPNDIDILITHMPPHGILDGIKDKTCSCCYDCSIPVGSESLRNIVLDGSHFKNLKLHVFGHIHEEGGKIFETSLTKFVNASLVYENYEHVNKPIRVIL